jgi:hypothetical protein
MGATSGGETSNSSEVKLWVLLVEKELRTLQKQHDGCYEWKRNCPLFRSNTTGDKSGGGTAHSSLFRSNTTGGSSGVGTSDSSEVT